MLTDLEARRLRWRLRRGMLELDLILQSIVVESLSEDQLNQLDQLLDWTDPELFDVVIEKKPLTEQYQHLTEMVEVLYQTKIKMNTA